ncbi:MAG: hypothetical protein AAGA60_10825 [Cyanobacteria bacterium P01_E01_bin.42]
MISAFTVGLTGGGLYAIFGDLGGFLLIPWSPFVLAFTRQLIGRINRDDAPPFSWNPPRRFWREAVVDLLILLVSAVGAYLAYMLPRSILLDDPRLRIPLRTREEQVVMVFWLLVCCYVHHVRYLTLLYFENRRKRKNKQANRSTLPRAKRPARSLEDSDRELNDLRWQEGQRRQQERVSRSSPRPAAPPPPPSRSTAIDDELERLRREMEDNNKL